MTTTRYTTFVAGLLVGLTIGFPSGVTISTAAATPAGQTQEDDPGWDCVSMGDRVCGPGNSNGVPAACYDEGGVIVALWPCSVVVNADGSSDVYTPDAR